LAKRSKSPADADANISDDEPANGFELSLAAVEQIVQQLESGELSLGDSLIAYEKGVRHLRRCHEQLSQVQRKIELLVGFDDSGRPVTEPFEVDAMSLEEKQRSRGKRRGADGERVDDSSGLF
jgi:exodeoxyribonuclease VII small subunit